MCLSSGMAPEFSRPGVSPRTHRSGFSVCSVAERQELSGDLLEGVVKRIPQQADSDAIRESFPHIQEAS